MFGETTRFNKHVTGAYDLITTHEQIRTGFLRIALEKNKVGDPYVKQAFAFKSMVKSTSSPEDFIHIPSIYPFLLTAAGLSDKSLQYLDDSDKKIAINELIEKFLKPAGNAYIDETVFRFLLIKGDSVGGSMRNRIGALGQEKLVRCLISCMNIQGIEYNWLPNHSTTWLPRKEDDTDIEKTLKAISWSINDKTGKKRERVFAFNLNIPIVKKNVDLCLFSANTEEYALGKIVSHVDKILMLGELKGGIDPAGADEHWKTANTSLERIRSAFASLGKNIRTTFVAAAIERAMADEIYSQLISNKLDNVANLTNNDQLVEYCNWILEL